MKREYAADTLKWNLTDLLTKEKDRATLDFLCECVDFLLKQPKPDPETGLMPCGCGGKAKIWPSDPTQFTHVITDYDLYSFECIKCETGTLFFNTKEDAKNAWNRAMGYADAVQGQ